jgi:hypothetical protein
MYLSVGEKGSRAHLKNSKKRYVQILKEAICSDSMLAYPNFSKEFILMT